MCKNFLSVYLGFALLAGLLTIVPKSGTRAADTAKEPTAADDERAIRALFEKINRAMSADSAEQGVAIMKDVISEKGHAAVIPNLVKPGEAFVSDRKGMLNGLAHSLRVGPKWGTHQVQKIIIVGPIAYEIGISKGPGPDDKGAGWCNIFAKEDVGWRLVYSTPAESLEKLLETTGKKTIPRGK